MKTHKGIGEEEKIRKGKLILSPYLRGQKKGGENEEGRMGAREEEEEHLSQVIDGEGEEENHGAVENQFAQTNQQASRLQTRLHEQTATRDQSTRLLYPQCSKRFRKADAYSFTGTHPELGTCIPLFIDTVHANAVCHG